MDLKLFIIINTRARYQSIFIESHITHSIVYAYSAILYNLKKKCCVRIISKYEIVLIRKLLLIKIIFRLKFEHLDK